LILKCRFIIAIKELYVRFSAQYRDIQRASKSLAACYRDSPNRCQTHAFLPTLTSPDRQPIAALERLEFGDIST